MHYLYETLIMFHNSEFHFLDFTLFKFRKSAIILKKMHIFFCKNASFLLRWSYTIIFFQLNLQTEGQWLFSKSTTAIKEKWQYLGNSKRLFWNLPIERVLLFPVDGEGSYFHKLHLFYNLWPACKAFLQQVLGTFYNVWERWKK